MRRVATLATVAVAATVIAGILTTGGSAQAPGERTFKLIQGSGGSFKLIDNAPKARNPRNPRLSVGDAFVLTSPLFNEALAASAVLRGGATIAVVGGTGAYEGARGSITDRELPRGRTEATVHLLP